MLACEGSVTTACACANEKRTPDAASASMAGVTAGPPSQPSASPRSVSIVISRTLRSEVRSNSVDLFPHAAELAPKMMITRTATSKVLNRTVQLCAKDLDLCQPGTLRFDNETSPDVSCCCLCTSRLVGGWGLREGL